MRTVDEDLFERPRSNLRRCYVFHQQKETSIRVREENDGLTFAFHSSNIVVIGEHVERSAGEGDTAEIMHGTVLEDIQYPFGRQLAEGRFRRSMFRFIRRP